MSLRAELVRVGVRLFMKRRSSPAVSIEQIRRNLAAAQRLIPRPPAGTQTVALDAGGVPANRITTAASQPDCHVLYIHGGGYVSGSPALYRAMTWRLAAAARANVLAIDYRLAPEHPFPAALEDAAAAYRWLLAEGVAPERLAVMGESAGGGLTFALMLKLRDEGVPLPAAVVGLSPWTDLALTGPSFRRNAKADPMLDAGEAQRLSRCYLAGADPRAPYASPLYGDLAGLPPSLIHVGSDEILLDDSTCLADRLRAAQCELTLEVWPRMPHVWHAFATVLPEARKAIERIGAFVQGRMTFL